MGAFARNRSIRAIVAGTNNSLHTWALRDGQYTNDDDLVQVMAAIGVHDVVQVSFEDIKSNGKSKGYVAACLPMGNWRRMLKQLAALIVEPPHRFASIAMISFAGEDSARFVKQFIEERYVSIYILMEPLKNSPLTCVS